MAQLVLAEPTIILAGTDIEGTELNENWVGKFQVALTTAGTDPVKLERLIPDTETWQVCRLANNSSNSPEIQLINAGDTLDITLTKGFTYRFATATAGAVVHIDNH